MSWQNLWPYLFWTVVCLLNVGMMGLFAGMEIGLYVMNKVRVELRAESNQPAAKSLFKQLHQPNHMLAVLLIGTNIHSYLTTFAITAIFLRLGAAHQAEFYTIVAATPLLFVFGDSVPKNVFRRLAESLVYRLAWLLTLADKLFTYTGLSLLVKLFSNLLLKLLRTPPSNPALLGHEGLVAVFDESHAAGALTFTQTRMAENVMHIHQVHLADVMTRKAKVASVVETIGRDEFLTTIAECDYSRLPMLDQAGKVVGVIDVYDVLADPQQQPPIHWQRPPFTLPASLSVTEALYRMQRARRSLAVVTSKSNDFLGVVTIKDLVEEIVGEIEVW